MVSGTRRRRSAMLAAIAVALIANVCLVTGVRAAVQPNGTTVTDTSSWMPAVAITPLANQSTTPIMAAAATSASASATESYPKKISTELLKFLSNTTANGGTSRRSYASSMSTGNELWDNIVRDCLARPTFKCLQKNVYHYLDDTLNLDDVNVTSRFTFIKNRVDYTLMTKDNAEHGEADEDNEIVHDNQGRAINDSPLEEVTNALYGKGVRFMMNHDIQLKMPDMMFEGATFRISPRSIEGNGAIVKLELIPNVDASVDNVGTGRIFIFKKLKKLFKNKLLLSFLAIVLIIKLIKIKLIWILPVLVGVGTAKKLVLKFLLFLFPALSHIFKLCSWYHQNYHQTKFHHHSHQINHLHTAVVPPWYGSNDHEHVYSSPPHGAEVIYSSPPRGHPSEYLHGAPSGTHQHAHASDWELSGPGLGSEYISDIHRNALVSPFKPKVDDANEISSWGLGHSTISPIASHSVNTNPFMSDRSRIYKPQQNMVTGPSFNIPNNVHKRTPPVAHQIAAQYNPAAEQQQQIMREAQQKYQAQAQEVQRIQAEQKLIAQQQRILNQQPFVQDGNVHMGKTMDPFYSPILSKIDKIFFQLGFVDEPCKERLVCSMYKNPTRYSPHSNFVSAELSRDSNELQKPTATNEAVVRFYRYVQAARDGQDQRDCLRLYPQCTINTERK